MHGPKKEGKRVPKLYWAYGSNLNKRQMLVRCPAAVPLEALTVQNLVLRFRGVADVAYLTGAYAEGALWEITPECERALDAYEGVGPGGFGGLYKKVYFDYVDPETGQTHKVLFYKMNRHGIMPPSEGYLDCIIEGYADFGIDTRRLVRAVEHAWRKKDMNGFMSYRWQKAGKPRMARPERIAVIEGMADEDDEFQFPETKPLDLRRDLDPSERPALSKKQRKIARKKLIERRGGMRLVKDEPLPDVCLRACPENANHTLACTITEKAEDWFKENIKAAKVESEWLFKYAAHAVAGLLQKKGLTVAILEKLRREKMRP